MFTPSEDELHRRGMRSTLPSQHEQAFSIAFYATGRYRSRFVSGTIIRMWSVRPDGGKVRGKRSPPCRRPSESRYAGSWPARRRVWSPVLASRLRLGASFGVHSLLMGARTHDILTGNRARTGVATVEHRDVVRERRRRVGGGLLSDEHSKTAHLSSIFAIKRVFVERLQRQYHTIQSRFKQF